MSATAEEALSRARAIAARLSGNDGADASPGTAAATAPTNTSTTTAMATTTKTKRKRWGVAPDIVAAAQEAIPGLEAAKKAKTVGGESTSKRIWVPTTKERPESHFFSFFSSRLEEIVDKVNAENPGSKEKVQLELKGRGSSNRPPLPGIPEEPMHVIIKGPGDLISKADTLLDGLISDAETAPCEAIPTEESERKNALALATTNHQSTSAYRPATVAQLISNNPVLHNDGEELMEEEIHVPNGVVGFLIGRGGENISSMQARSGCKIQIQKEHELRPGQTHRVITLQAPTQESIDQCRGMIESMVQDRIRAAGGSTNASNNVSKDVKVNEAVSAGHALVQVEVPDADVGLIIGKGGATIKAIQDSTGASIQIPPAGNPDNPKIRTVSVTHPNVEGAKMAKQQIEDLLKSKPSYAQNQGQQITLQVLIPDKDVGLCIGRQGCVIKEMQQKTGTRIQIPSQPTPGQPHRIATVSGTKDGVNKVQALIERIVNEQSSASVMSNSPPGQQQQHRRNSHQHPYGDQGQKNHYSAEWQAYYAAQAAAQQQQQQSPAPAPPAAAPAPASASNAYHEQFFRYSYYYGEDAARQYYGAWSPPVGTPNPYGVNPNGITAAPAGGSAAAPVATTPAPTPSPAAYAPPAAGEVRDSSVRKVSNLPAWMTRAS